MIAMIQVAPQIANFYPTRKAEPSRTPLLTRACSSLSRSHRYAVLGAGFAGLSVAWHLLEHSAKESHVHIDIFDEIGIGGGASGVAGGLIHPYSPKAKLLWRGAECWNECLKLLGIAEGHDGACTLDQDAYNLAHNPEKQIVWKRGILRPATTTKNADILKENARNCSGVCTIKVIDKDAAQKLIPEICLPLDSAIFMPSAVNIHPKRYLQALFLACQKFASRSEGREIHLFKEPINSLLELAGEYTSVIICLGAKVDMLPELSGKLPLRMCRGVVAHLQLPDNTRSEYGPNSPSILSNAWLAIQGSRSMVMGATWDWKSRNYSSTVSAEEALMALDELLPKASTVYPCLSNWRFVGASGGLRAMPPLTALGSVPLLGCVDDIVREQSRHKYWLVGGLGSRGLLYHAMMGKLTAQAVISRNEDVIPFELTSWMKTK
ncbi:hypothetical protein QJS10_CPB19g00653 [Acorus calamus]|uniref:FAD dependent oxidoreductase domain-containing protein n=1 Tax=Acorus calamus TaxID=4465 RepID=A0AAV9CG83_ACOCL|nr:hypothetical protein QJS10_CPB19g00653 [Acorus calamus]